MHLLMAEPSFICLIMLFSRYVSRWTVLDPPAEPREAGGSAVHAALRCCPGPCRAVVGSEALAGSGPFTRLSGHLLHTGPVLGLGRASEVSGPLSPSGDQGRVHPAHLSLDKY